jgi:GLPGLI family protein
MKRLLLLSVMVLMGLQLFAQSFEGKIVFEISLIGMNDPQMQAMMPKETVAYFKKNKSRMEMNMMMGMKNVTISDGDTKSAVTLMDMMGQKYAITNDGNPVSPEQKKMMEDTKVEVTKETKKIAGYTCSKAIITVPAGGKLKEATSMEIWFTKDLSLNKEFVAGPMGKIDGSALEFSIKQNGLDMKFSARDVLKQPVSDDLFLIPSGYKKMTQEELMKTLGGF